MVRAFPARSKVRLWALEAHDLALTKLERSNERDIRDVTWHQSTLKMWIDACWPEDRRSPDRS
jgi:hypothetical protein